MKSWILFFLFLILGVAANSAVLFDKQRKLIHPADKILAHSIDRNIARDLEHLLIRAEIAFKDKSIQEATELYQQIVRLSYKTNHTQTGLETITYSYLRLAFLYPNKKDYYIAEAKKFHSDLKNLNGILPSHLLQAFHLPAQTIDFKFKYLQGIKYVVVNSKVYDALSTSRVSLHPGKNRVQFIYNNRQDQLIIGGPEEISQRISDSAPLNWGTCESPRIAHAAFKAIKFRMRLPGNCAWDFKNGIFTNMNPKIADTTRKENTFIAPDTSLIPPPESKLRWKKAKPWVYALTAVLGTYLVIENSKKPSGSREVVYLPE
ncbi:MAG: hypothetical protein AB8E15_04805 [Bdellovibrionales bacterium]